MLLFQVLPLQLPSLNIDARRLPVPPPLQAYLVGATFALAASPCSTPVLATLLGWVSTAEDPFTGAGLLLAYSCGYVAPLLVAATATVSMGGGSLRGRVGSCGYVTSVLVAGQQLCFGSGGSLGGRGGGYSRGYVAPLLVAATATVSMGGQSLGWWGVCGCGYVTPLFVAATATLSMGGGSLGGVYSCGYVTRFAYY